jgi:hypothetical protein
MTSRGQLLWGAIAALALMAAIVATSATGSSRQQSTALLSRSLSGGVPNGASTNAVISADKRYARVIAFESKASDLVANDRNGQTDVFAVLRHAPFGNDGSPWTPGKTVLVSRTYNGQPSDGPSYSAAVDGSFHHAPSCVAFLSQAGNLVPGDTNGKVDAFVSRPIGAPPKRVSLPGGRQSAADTSAVAVSGDCSRIAFVAGDRLYVRTPKRTFAIGSNGTASHPSFAHGLRNDLVFAASGGVYLSRDGTGRPKLVAKGGRQPVYNDLKRQVVAYVIDAGGHSQVAYRDLGGPQHLVSQRRGQVGNGDSGQPVIGNAGFYVAFQTEANNLGTNANSFTGDNNGRPDSYLYTDVRKITLLESSEQKGVPLAGGGFNPSMSFYANYMVFDSPAPMNNPAGEHQIYMRYLGGI